MGDSGTGGPDRTETQGSGGSTAATAGSFTVDHETEMLKQQISD